MYYTGKMITVIVSVFCICFTRDLQSRFADPILLLMGFYQDIFGSVRLYSLVYLYSPEDWRDHADFLWK